MLEQQAALLDLPASAGRPTYRLTRAERLEAESFSRFTLKRVPDHATASGIATEGRYVVAYLCELAMRAWLADCGVNFLWTGRLERAPGSIDPGDFAIDDGRGRRLVLDVKGSDHPAHRFLMVPAALWHKVVMFDILVAAHLHSDSHTVTLAGWCWTDEFHARAELVTVRTPTLQMRLEDLRAMPALLQELK